MKKFAVLFLGILALVIAPSFTKPAAASGTASLKITWYATGTIEGYSYNSKMKVFVDGKEVGESPVKDQKEKNTFTVKVPKGRHDLKCIIWAEYKPGQWEERLIANDYSYDWMYMETVTFKKKNKMNIEFSVKNEKSIRH